MNPFPKEEELLSLRRGLRRRKLPIINDGMSGSCEGLGYFAVSKKDARIVIEWQTSKGPRKSADFLDLCVRPELELNRLELGWLVAEFYDLRAQSIMSQIGHPIEAFREASAPLKESENWRHWAKVKPGHMIGI